MPDFTAPLKREIKGIRIGIPKEYFIEGMDAAVEASVRKAITLLESLGAVPVAVTMPHTEYAVATYYLLANV